MVIVTTHLWAGHAGCGGMLSTWLENLINRVNTVDTVERSRVKATSSRNEKGSADCLVWLGLDCLVWLSLDYLVWRTSGMSRLPPTGLSSPLPYSGLRHPRLDKNCAYCGKPGPLVGVVARMVGGRVPTFPVFPLTPASVLPCVPKVQLGLGVLHSGEEVEKFLEL